MSNITSIKALKAEATARGSHFFDADTMRFFASQIVPRSIVNERESTRGYFVTSEKYGDEKRHYSVRSFDTAEPGLNIKTVGETEYATAEKAINAARFIAGVETR